MTNDHQYASISATNLLVRRRNRSKYVIHFQRIVIKTIQLMSKNVEQDFRVRSGIDVATRTLKQFLLKFVRIRQITVVSQGNTERGVDIKRLRLGCAGAACRWVTNVADTHIALQAKHMPCFKHIFDQPVCFTQTEAIIGINSDDACGILPTVLKHR